jgi:calcineurin-like phosphoesterase family protein
MKWFTSDTHFNHQSIIHSCHREWKNVWAMNAYMIEKWNEVVKKGDIVYHLGDFALPNKGDGHDVGWIIDQLQGQIILIRGNHDHNIRKLEDKFAKVEDLEYVKGDGDDKKYRVMLCHYPMRTWRASCHGSWHLHGHSHGNLEPMGKMLDVGVDVHKFYPVSFTQVKEIIMARREGNEDEGTKGCKK